MALPIRPGQTADVGTSAAEMRQVLQDRVGANAPNPNHGPFGLYRARLGAPFPSSEEQIVKAMNQAGPKSRGVVFVMDRLGNGHVFNVMHDGSKVIFWDKTAGNPGTFAGAKEVWFYRTR